MYLYVPNIYGEDKDIICHRMQFVFLFCFFSLRNCFRIHSFCLLVRIYAIIYSDSLEKEVEERNPVQDEWYFFFVSTQFKLILDKYFCIIQIKKISPVFTTGSQGLVCPLEFWTACSKESLREGGEGRGRGTRRSMVSCWFLLPLPRQGCVVRRSPGCWTVYFWRFGSGVRNSVQRLGGPGSINWQWDNE